MKESKVVFGVLSAHNLAKNLAKFFAGIDHSVGTLWEPAIAATGNLVVDSSAPWIIRVHL
jgi:hypothetical protein